MATIETNSPEVQSLNSEKIALTSQQKDLETRQDLFKSLSEISGVLAVVCGVLTLGWQHFETKKAYAVRPIVERLSTIASRLRVIEKEESDRKMAGAQKDIEEAKGETQRTKERTERLASDNLHIQQDLAASNEEIEHLKKSNLELSAKLLPRNISVIQAGLISDFLKTHPPHTASFACMLNNVESCRYAEELASVLRSGGWSVDPDTLEVGGYMKPPEGLIVQTANVKNPAGEVLLNALSRAGISFSVEINTRPFRGAVKIVVGAKPLEKTAP